MVRGQLREWIYEWIYILKWRTGCHSHLRGRTDQNCAGVWGRTRTGEAEERDYDGPLAADLDSWIKGWGRHLLKWKISADFQETKREAMASFVNHIVWGHRRKTHIGQKNIRRIRGCLREIRSGAKCFLVLSWESSPGLSEAGSVIMSIWRMRKVAYRGSVMCSGSRS